MATCTNCGSSGPRVRSRWTEKGLQLPDECPSCSPDSFEKFTAPSDKKIWMGFEAHPEEYQKQYNEDGGVTYVRKPEYQAEQEQRLCESTEEERTQQERAIANKRATRRTLPMDAAEMAAALGKAETIADWIVSAAAAGTDVN